MNFPGAEKFITPSREFFLQDARLLAQQLLGCVLVHHEEIPCGGIITETEAYLPDDPASHSFRGKTLRNAAMFLEGGYWYVYIIYGQHLCINVVCGKKDVGTAILLRGIRPQYGLSIIRSRRPDTNCSGPGRLSQVLGIAKEKHNFSPVDKGNLRIYLPLSCPRDMGYTLRSTRRIGMRVNKEVFWRYLLHTSPP